MTAAPRPEPWRDIVVPESRCPFCDYRMDRASNADGSAPKLGDISVCICCASALVFTDDLKVRAMTAAEWRDLDAKEKAELGRYQNAVRSLGRRQMGPT